MKGKLISISGLDGAGKSTQLKILEEKFIRNGFNCINFQFDATHYGEKAFEELEQLGNYNVIFTRLCIPWENRYPLIHDFVYKKELQSKNLAMAVTTVFAGGCIQVYEECIKPLLERGVHIVSDRFWFDDIVYRGFWLEEEFIRSLYQTIPRPDLPIFLNTPPDIVHHRNTTRIDGTSPLMKHIDSIRTVSERFLKLAEKESMLIVNGNDTVEEIAERLYQCISKLIPFD